MRHRSFGEFVDKKKRESVRQLRLVGQLLEKTGMKVDDFISTNEDHEPYIFCHNTSKSGSFDGVRIYKIGNELAFRIQKESKTHPYGSAYPLPIESMFNDFLSDDGVDENKAGKKIIEAVGKEIRTFFEKSAKAEQDNRKLDYGNQDVGNVLVRTTGTDYSAQVYSRG